MNVKVLKDDVLQHTYVQVVINETLIFSIVLNTAYNRWYSTVYQQKNTFSESELLSISEAFIKAAEIVRNNGIN